MSDGIAFIEMIVVWGIVAAVRGGLVANGNVAELNL